MVIEVSFPRGGRKPPSNNKPEKIRRVEYDLFGKSKPKIQRRDTRIEVSEKTLKEREENEEILKSDIAVSTADLLSYRTLQDGMVVMGCIREIKRMSITVLLPGRITGNILITQISAPYTKLLQSIAENKEPESYRQIRQIFHPGQYIVTKIKSLEVTDDKNSMNVTSAPHEINSELSYKSIVSGMFVWGAIGDCEDHGYVVDLGIKNCRAFLPKTNIDEDKNYSVGEVLWFVVDKYVIAGAASTATLNVKKITVTSCKIKNLETSLDYLQPGTQVDFTINQKLNNGLEGTFLNNYKGYVHESYLLNALSGLQSYKNGQTVPARILYITPITKLTFLTLRGLENSDRADLKDGCIANCQILNITRGGLYVKINKNQKGFVPYKRLKKPISTTSDLNYSEIISKNYSIGSHHSCRVLSYDYMEQVFICTMEKSLLQEKIFSYSDLTLGQEVLAEIIEVQKNGILTKIGNVSSYILNDHLTDSVLSSYENIKLKYNPGQKIKTKVWRLNEDRNSVYLTLKPSFLNAKNVLTSYEQAEHNKRFPGTIVQITRNGVLVTFFGDVKGWIPRNQLSFERVQRPEHMFNLGQVVTCTVVKCSIKTRKLTLSLQPPKSHSKCKQLRLGQHVDVTITAVLQTGLEVEVKGMKVLAIIPLYHLTSSYSLANLILETYSVGDLLCNAVCVNVGHGVPILSLRDTELNEKCIPDWDTIEQDTVLYCSINSVNERCILLQSPIKSFDKLVVVLAEDILDASTNKIRSHLQLQLKRNQGVLAKVTNVIKDQQNIYATMKLSECWNGDLNTSYNLVYNLLMDMNRVKTNWMSNNKALGKFELGEVVTATVTQVHQNGLTFLKLPHDVKGRVDPAHSIDGLSVGNTINAQILFLNFNKNIAELTLKKNIINRVNKLQTGQINTKPEKSLVADILIVKRDFILVSLRGHGNRQMAYLPHRLHTNDFLLPASDIYKIGNTIKVEIVKVENGFIVACPKMLKKRFMEAAKMFQQQQHAKRNRTLSDSSNDGQPTKKKTKIKNEDELDNVCSNEEQINRKKRSRKNKQSKADENQEKEIDFVTSLDNNMDNEVKDIEEVMQNESVEEKMEISTDINVDDKIDSQNTEKKRKKQKRKSDTDDSTLSVTKNDPNDTVVPVLSGANNFWNTPSTKVTLEDSSDDEINEEDAEVKKKQKKKKLTPAERAEAARLEEERLRKIETELADAESTPKTADQFDRLVLAKPNSSLLWINYIAFHLEGTEIEKARAVARKALNTIDFREEQEKLNVWIAFLNLENRYGTKDSFMAVLEEAVRMNDSLTVHLQALQILAESSKSAEFLELLNTVMRRYKQEPNMWTNAAEACYICDQKEQARSLMQRAVKSLDEKQHINVIVQFAFMESKWGEPERAEAILEKILASYPRRVDVWCSYVDMLVKGDRIHVARNVLERASSQKLPARKMKTIFSKFLNFETKFGEEDGIKKVRQMASDYVNTTLK